jgi:hypothetical protein
VSDDQVITQAIKALMVRPLHNHLVREMPKTVSELCEQFTKFSKSEVQYFCKLEQQRKVTKPAKAPRPCYSDNQRNYLKPVHNIDYDGCEAPENWEKNFGGPSQERNLRTFVQRSPNTNREAELQTVAGGMTEVHTQ